VPWPTRQEAPAKAWIGRSSRAHSLGKSPRLHTFHLADLDGARAPALAVWDDRVLTGLDHGPIREPRFDAAGDRPNVQRQVPGGTMRRPSL
jgi:hypothetical protein